MTVLFIVESIGLGHATRSYEIIKEFLKKGHRVEAIAHNSAADFFKSKSINTHEIPLSIFPQKNKETVDFGKTLLQGIKLRNIVAIGAISGIIKKKKPSAIIIDSSISGMIAANTTKDKATPILFITTDNTYQSGLKTTEKQKQNFGLINNFIQASVDAYIVPDFPPPYTISENNLVLNKKINFVGPLSWAKGFDIPKKTKGVILTQGGSNIVSEKITTILKNKVYTPTREEYEKKFITADVVIHHGGHTTTMDCIVLGKPQITIPIDGYTERINNGKKIEKLGLGKNLDEKWLDKNTLDYAIEEVKEYKKNIIKFSKYARSYDAPKKVYEIYESLKKK